MLDKKVLVIGATGGLAKTIIKDLENNKYIIDTVTYRQEQKIYDSYNWKHLDLENINTINNLINGINTNKYSKIIFVAGNTLGFGFDQFSYEELQKFHNSYYFNYLYLITECSKLLSDDGHIVFISSIAANKAISDPNYSAVKAGLQAFIMSLSTLLKNNQVAYSISPGLIYETPAFYSSNYNGDISKLATKEQISSIILSADQSYNGKLFEIGY